MTDELELSKKGMLTTEEDSIAERDWFDLLNRKSDQLIELIRERQSSKNQSDAEKRKLDKGLIYVFSFAMILSLFFIFYLIIIDKIEPVKIILFPIITSLLSLLAGYFAGSGRRGDK